MDILCDPYIVQKDDWVIKLFQRRGQISEQDFPEFLIIFKQLNPSIKDVNKIIPGQHILIPLKKLSKSSLPGQSTGMVTIPFVTISKLPDVIHENSSSYEVRSGDNVSSIVSQAYTKKGEISYGEAMKLFKLINPEITNIDRIYPGQAINIPKPNVDIRQWYQSLFNSPQTAYNSAAITMNTPDTRGVIQKPAQGLDKTLENPPENKNFIAVASTLNAKLMHKGQYFFPKTGQGDFVLDLSRYPVMEMPDGTRILFQENNDLSSEDQNLLKSHWKNLKFTSLSLQSSFEEIMSKVVQTDGDFEGFKSFSFEDRGVRISIQGKWMVANEPTDGTPAQPSFGKRPFTFISIANPKDKPISASLRKYLGKFNINIKEITPEGVALYPDISDSCESFQMDKKIIYSVDIKDFVKEFASTLGFQYAEKTEISFPYAGIQVKATSNLISTSQGAHLLVDFGDLYGDAVSSIKNTGLNVLQVNHEMAQDFIAGEILKGLHLKYDNTSEITALDRPENLTISLDIPGVTYKTPGGEEYMITPSLADDDLVCFVNSAGYKMIILYRPSQSAISSKESSFVSPS
ncbi:MAG: LysM peptidoglycan-binding domain-containing protein [Proteobacteria bacterium]|nr:LysM peptidoglycan-binding domain-containing protein [Pseudomonadota bacterium]MBU4469624.1 LysM peptidoglycan-binding domain-containing protein [Pseudomonadota bacterium]MCG2753302.1 LysM peptidoglycan-binding domain-containing protein [Desulfobacteraceae bacterium]